MAKRQPFKGTDLWRDAYRNWQAARDVLACVVKAADVIQKQRRMTRDEALREGRALLVNQLIAKTPTMSKADAKKMLDDALAVAVLPPPEKR